MYKLLLITIVILFTGCNVPSTPEPIQIVHETTEVSRVTKCVSPEVDCNFEGSGYTPTKKLLQCVIEQKRALEVCK